MTLSANQSIYLLIYDMRTNGYTYDLDFEFIPDDASAPIPNPTPTPDTTPPTITLIGNDTVNINVGDSYSDLGATAIDDVDGDITNSIQTNSNVNTSTAGTYHVTYSVSDSAGNSASKTRTVIVNNITPPTDTTPPTDNTPPTTTIQIDDENINNQCPGELIDVMDNITSYTKISAQGTMKGRWDIDRFRFAPAVDGKLKINLNSTQAVIFQAGSDCNQRDFFISYSNTSHTKEVTLSANQSIYLLIYDMRTNGYTYDLDFEFIPDGNSAPTDNTPPTNTPRSTSLPCPEGQFQRVKTKECLALKNPTWGFKKFNIPSNNVYTLTSCTQSALQNLLDTIPASGGKIILPACTINTTGGINIRQNNTILQGAGMGKTIIKNRVDSAIKLYSNNIILRNFTLDGNNGSSLNGIQAISNNSNILIEFVEIKNFKPDQGSGIYFYTDTVSNSKTTIRYNKTSNSMHGINVRTHTSAKMLIYSNIAFDNYYYGTDISTIRDVEVAGNHLYNNKFAGAKSPAADNITYHHNDINSNQKAGIVYGNGDTDVSDGIRSIIIESNDLSNNSGAAFAPWMSWNGVTRMPLEHLTLKNNNVTNSTDSSGYHILVDGIKTVDVYGDHGRIFGAYTQH